MLKKVKRYEHYASMHLETETMNSPRCDTHERYKINIRRHSNKLEQSCWMAQVGEGLDKIPKILVSMD